MSGAPSKCLLWFNGQNFDHCTCYGALGVNHNIPHTSLRTNGSAVEAIEKNPFMLRLSKHAYVFQESASVCCQSTCQSHIDPNLCPPSPSCPAPASTPGQNPWRRSVSHR